jgi:hypothetical protein
MTVVSLCVWCRSSHTTPFQLCAECDARAAALRLEAGQPLRAVQEVGEEPSD